jgi:hypothetical protein
MTMRISRSPVSGAPAPALALRPRSRVLAALAAAAILSACNDATAPVQGDGMPRNLERGIYALVNVASETEQSAQVELYLKRVQTDARLASYQGELTYDPAVLTLEHTDLPTGLIGTTNETSPGHVRFAGAALDGVGDVPVLAMRFTRHGAVAQQTFQVKVEEVAGSDGFADLTSQISTRGAFFHKAGR